MEHNSKDPPGHAASVERSGTSKRPADGRRKNGRRGSHSGYQKGGGAKVTEPEKSGYPHPCSNCGEIGHYAKTCKKPRKPFVPPKEEKSDLPKPVAAKKQKRCAYDRKTTCPGKGDDICVAYCPPDDNQKAYCGRGNFFLESKKKLPIEVNVGPKKLIDRFERL